MKRETPEPVSIIFQGSRAIQYWSKEACTTVTARGENRSCVDRYRSNVVVSGTKLPALFHNLSCNQEKL